MESLAPNSLTSPISTNPWQIKLLYDGECPLCLREVKFLQKKDGSRNLVAFVNIADEDYNPADHGGIDYGTAMGRIHALLPDGTVLRDLAVFRRVYQILGMGWVYAPTQWPIVGKLANLIYQIWAAWRLPLTGRPSLTTLIQQKQKEQGANCRCQL